MSSAESSTAEWEATEKRAGAPIDPYRDWLSIAESQRPLDPYQLLGLEPLERNPAKIRMSFDRQRVALDSVKDDADSEQWAAVRAELDEALTILNDPERRVLLDARIKRRAARSLSANVAPPPSAAALTIHCRGCKHPNSGSRRFCAQCGGSLWEKCGGCGAEIAADERFCGSCGIDVLASLESQQKELEAGLAEARLLADGLRFDEAITILRRIAVVEDPKADRQAQQALDLIAKYEQTRESSAAAADFRFEQAKLSFQNFSFETALVQLDEIPLQFRTDEVKELRRRAYNARNEVLTLGGEIREAIAKKRTDGLLSKIERLLQLRPNYAKARVIAEQLRDKLVQRAKKELVHNDYQTALDILGGIPAFIRNEAADSLADKAEELKTLEQCVKKSPVVDDATLALARRWAKAAVTNPQAQELAAELEARTKRKPTDPRTGAIVWAAAPKRPKFGAAVDPLRHFVRAKAANDAVAAQLAEHPGQFFVAFGLALQGLERSAVSINLAPQEKGGMLGKLGLPFRKRAIKSAWGLDLSATALKAVRLTCDEKTGAIEIAAAEFIPHSKSLLHPDAEVEKTDILYTTFRRFLGKHKLEGERVVGSLPNRAILGRFFELPPMSAKKVTEAVTFEAKHQVPIDLSELVYNYQILTPSEAPSTDEQTRRVLLIAAREFHAKERLKLFKDAGVNIDLLAADAAALHNTIHYECFEDPEFQHSRPGAILTFDLGADGANCVVSHHGFCWFRTSSLSGHDFNQALIKQFKLTADQAEQLKREPAKARRLSQWLSTLQPLFTQATSEIERTLASYRKLDYAEPVGQIFGHGGGFKTFGLFQELRGG